MVKANYDDPLCVVTLYCFFGWSFLNLNHVKTTKYFHNFLHIMVKHNPKKIILFLYYGGSEYICMKKINAMVFKNVNILQK
jgi:hypothetical protein